MSRLSAVGISGLQAGEDVKEYITYVEDGSGHRHRASAFATTRSQGIEEVKNDFHSGHIWY